MNTCEGLGKIREARALLKDEADAGNGSRELSLAMTKLDEAILWRQCDMQLKAPTINECKVSPNTR